MKILFLLIPILFLISCSTGLNNSSSDSNSPVLYSTSDSNSPVNYRKGKTTIFTYDVSPISYAQPAALIEGRFVWKDGCIYLEDNGECSAVLFPAMPKGIFSWNEANKTVVLNGNSFEMGDYIRTNGGVYKYFPGSNGHKYLEEQGGKRCLTPQLIHIGTYVKN